MNKKDGLIYEIEEFHIKDCIEKKYCLIYGWCYSSKNSSYDYGLTINGNEVDFYIEHIFRNDICSNVLQVPSEKIGFKIYAIFDEIHSLQFYLRNDNNQNILINLTQKDVDNIIEISSIDYYIEDLSFDKSSSIYLVKGWAHSYINDVDINIEDATGNSIETDIQILNRLDLLQLQLVEKNQTMCGFSIRFKGKGNKKYFLTLNDGKSKLKIEIEVDNKNIMTFVNSYLKALNYTNIKKAIHYLQTKGISQFLTRLKEGPNGERFNYQNWFDMHKATEDELFKQRKVQFKYSPKISIIVATFNTEEKYLKEMIDTVVAQTYSNWELCIGDGSTTDFVQSYVKNHYAQDSRIKFKRLEKNFGISGNMNGALSLATGDYVALYDHDDLLTPDALFEVVNSLQDFRYDIVYTDEDKLDNASGTLNDPHFKPDFSVDLLRSQNYICHFLVVNKNIVDEIGGLHAEYDGSQDLDYVLRCYEKANAVYHIPKILYHWRMHANSTAQNPESKMYCYQSGKKAIQHHLDRLGIAAKVEMMPKPLYGMYRTTYELKDSPKLSIIVINDNSENTKMLLQSIEKNNVYSNLEIIVINHSSNDFFYDEDRVKILTWNKDINYAAMNNYGARIAVGTYLLFIRSSLECVLSDSITELISVCQREDVGVVGGKVLSKDQTILHAGMIYEKNGDIKYPFAGQNQNSNGYMCKPKLITNYSILSSMCMMIKRSDFEKLNGFSEEFKHAYFDVDFCLRIREILKKNNVYNGFSIWGCNAKNFCFGYEIFDKENDKLCIMKEYQILKEKYKYVFSKEDPFYSPNFSDKYDAYTIA